MEIKNLYDDAVYNSILERINLIKPDAKPHWGTFNVAQALDHLAEVLSTYNGKPLQVNLMALLFKKRIKKTVFSNQPYKKSIPTNPQFIKDLNTNFDESKQRLLSELNAFKTLPIAEVEKIKHQLFGYIIPTERGWSQYKHLNHHLEQFGV